MGTGEPRLTVLTFLWGDRYGVEYVDRLGNALQRHMDVPYRFVCVTDRPRILGRSVSHQIPIRDPLLTKLQGCFCRLRVFDPEWQRNDLGLAIGDRILVLDLDIVIVGKLAPLLARDEAFIILQGVNNHRLLFNGSVWLTTAGYRPDVWDDFSVEAASEVPYAIFPDDQSWMEHKLGADAGAYLPERDGVWAFRKKSWPNGIDLPLNARIVAFRGSRDPAQFVNLPFVRRNWLGIG